ncbi:MAG: hypothetical protein AAFY48_12865 [Bacteroidota bacterium]
MAKSRKKSASKRKREAPARSHRDAQITVIIGRNGTGKSTFSERIVKAVYKKALVITYNGAPKIWRDYAEIDVTDPKVMGAWKSGIRQVIAARYEESRNKNTVFEHIYKNYRNGPVIFDDCRGYIGSNVDNDRWFRQLILDFRHLMLDPYFVVHTPSDVPPRVWGFTSTVFVGATDSLASKRQITTDSLERIIEAQKRVNLAFRKAKARQDNSHYGLFIKVNT